MKKTLIAALLFGMTMGATSTNAIAKEKESVKITAESRANAEKMISRLYEIKSMDRSKMSIVERKELKKEVGGIKSELVKYRGEPVIYISVGAAILIAILLLLLL